MPQPTKVYGFVKHSDCYHATQNCPVLKHATKNRQVEVREYVGEDRATAVGHVRRCRLCLGDKVFEIAGQKARIHISDEQHSVLKCVVDIYGKRGSMTLRQISERRKRSVVSTYLIIKRLRTDGLVEHRLKLGGQRASGGSIVPTKRGLAVIRSEALPE